MPPKGSCPNCGQKEWLEHPKLHYFPRISRSDDDNGRYVADASNGIHVTIWRCNNCMYIMPFWEPD